MDKEFKKAVSHILEMTEGIDLDDRIQLLEHIINVMKEVSKFKETLHNLGIELLLRAEEEHE